MDLEALKLKPLKELKAIRQNIENELIELCKNATANATLIDEKEGLELFLQMIIYEKEYDKYIRAYEIIEYEMACDLGSETILAAMPKEEGNADDTKDYFQQIVGCTAYINQLKRQLKKIPSSVSFFIFENNHDLGKYYEAGLILIDSDFEDDEDEESTYDFISECENGLENWDEIALQELTRYKYFF